MGKETQPITHSIPITKKIRKKAKHPAAKHPAAKHPAAKHSKTMKKPKHRATGHTTGERIRGGKRIYRKSKSHHNIGSTLAWKNSYPKKYVDAFSKYYFRKPDVIAAKKGGMCLWYPKSREKLYLYDNVFPNIFTEHWCRDEMIKHMCPAKHTDFFYSFIDIELDTQKWADVLAISGSIGYDPLKKKLYARCGSIEANIASLYTCLLVNNGTITLKRLQREKIYARHIDSTSDKEEVIKMYKYLVKNLRKNVPKTGYWEVAFPDYKKHKQC